MESLSFAKRRLSREELFTGLGGALLVHGLIFGLAVLSPMFGHKTSTPMPFFNVDLVSMQDFGGGGSTPKKGAPAARAPAVPKGEESAKPAAAHKAAPIQPQVSRLKMEDPVAKSEPQLKKREAPEAPKFTETAQSTPSVEKSLDKLISKPKPAPKPTPIVQNARAESDKPPTQVAAKSAATAAADSDDDGEEGPPQRAAGSKNGTAGAKPSQEGTAGGAAESGTPGGSPNGAQVGAAQRLYYTSVWNAIRQKWVLPEALKTQKLETTLVIVVRRDGKILDLRVEKSSGNELYDESAKRAVRKADPLPAFPAVYTLPQEEIGLRFTPEMLS